MCTPNQIKKIIKNLKNKKIKISKKQNNTKQHAAYTKYSIITE